MDTKHTAEPWAVGAITHEDGEFIETAISALDGTGWVAVCLDFGFHNPDMREANARRIVACVNACAGQPTELLEATGLGLLGKSIDKIAVYHARSMNAEQQRDKLLAAAKITVGDLMDSYRTHGTEWFLDATRDLRNAIAEIEVAK